MLRLISYGILTALLFSCGSFFPAFGFIGIMLSPLPLALLGCSYGRNKAAISEIIAEVLLFLFISPYMALYFFIGCAPISGIICALKEFRQKFQFSAGENILICFTVSVFSKLILMIVFWFLTGHITMFPDTPQLEIILNEIYKEQPSLLEALQMVLYLFPYMIPLFVMLYSGAEAFLNYKLCVKFTKKKNFLPELPQFIDWKFPNSVLYALLFSLIAGLFINFRTWEEGSMFVFNLQLLVNIILFIQGLSFLLWLTFRFNFKPLTRFFSCLVLVFPFTWLIVIAAGMGELMADFREKLIQKK